MTGLGGPCILCGFPVRSRDCCQSRGHWGDGTTPCYVEYHGPILRPCPTCGEPEPTFESIRDCSLCNPPTPDRSGEADETRSGSAEGESGLPEGSS